MRKIGITSNSPNTVYDLVKTVFNEYIWYNENQEWVFLFDYSNGNFFYNTNRFSEFLNSNKIDHDDVIEILLKDVGHILIEYHSHRHTSHKKISIIPRGCYFFVPLSNYDKLAPDGYIISLEVFPPSPMNR